MKVLLTRRSLTQGILEVEGVQHPHHSSIFVYVNPLTGRENWECGGWHQSREDAVKKAEAMRVKRIATLTKELARLKALRFD